MKRRNKEDIYKLPLRISLHRTTFLWVTVTSPKGASPNLVKFHHSQKLPYPTATMAKIRHGQKCNIFIRIPKPINNPVPNHGAVRSSARLD